MYLAIFTIFFSVIACGEPIYIKKNGDEKRERQNRGIGGESPSDANKRGSSDNAEKETKPMAPVEDNADVLETGYQFVRASIQKECAGCHTDSYMIDLRSFPFKYEGSGAEFDIEDALVGFSGTEKQKNIIETRVILDQLIDAIDSGYMPPSGSLKHYPKMSESLSTWKNMLN